MGVAAPSMTIVTPSYIEPGVVMPIFQASGAFSLLGGRAVQNRLGDGDLYVYLKKLDMRTRIAAGQSAYNQLPSVSFLPSYFSSPTYLMRVRGEWDHHDAAAWSRWGMGIKDMQTLGMRQAHFQLARTALLYGFNPVNGEGLLYATGATQTVLPPDSNGVNTVVGYDNGEMAFFLISLITELKTRTYQLGTPRKFSIVGPQRVLGRMAYQNIVQLVQFQRVGAGTASTKELVDSVLAANGDALEWGYDDTLEGKGAGGTDAVILVMTEVESQNAPGINTNVFSTLEPNVAFNTTMYSDMAAPREIPTPLPGGAIDLLTEWRITSGWVIRPEAETICSMLYQ